MSKVLKEDVGSTGRYKILEAGDGTPYCTCPAWKFNQDTPKMCKHLREYLYGGKLVEVAVEDTITEDRREDMDSLIESVVASIGGAV